MLEVLGQDYVFTASAYGLRDGMIRWKLALKNALPPTMTIIGLAAAYALTGTFFVEVVFNWPGHRPVRRKRNARRRLSRRSWRSPCSALRAT